MGDITIKMISVLCVISGKSTTDIAAALVWLTTALAVTMAVLKLIIIECFVSCCVGEVRESGTRELERDSRQSPLEAKTEEQHNIPSRR